jgi:hypothetical protein
MKGKVAYISRWRRAQIGNMIARGVLVRANSKKSFFYNLVARDENYLLNPIARAEPEPEAPIPVISTSTPAWYIEPAPLIDPNVLAPQTQYMDMDEFRAISGEGIIIPPGSSVVVIPVSQYDNPELYNTIVEVAEMNPGVPIADIVSSVVNSDANPVYNVMLPGGPLPLISDVVKTDVINNQVIVDVRHQYPDAPIAVIEKAIEEGNFIPVITAVTAPLVNKPITTPVLTSVTPDKLIIPDTMAKDEDQMYLSGAAAAAGILALLLL